MPSLSNAKGLLNVGKDAEVRIYIAAGTIVAGRTVAFDETQTDETRARKVVEGAADAFTFGIALEAATAGSEVRVCVGGYVEGALTDGSIVSGSALVAKAGGAVGAYANTDVTPILGVALEADGAGTTADVFLYKLVP